MRSPAVTGLVEAETIQRVLASGERVSAGNIWNLPSYNSQPAFSKLARKFGTNFFPQYSLFLLEPSLFTQVACRALERSGSKERSCMC